MGIKQGVQAIAKTVRIGSCIAGGGVVVASAMAGSGGNAGDRVLVALSGALILAFGLVVAWILDKFVE